MGTTNNSNILFTLSGSLLGAYKFEQNPSQMSIVPPTQKYNQIKVLNGENLYQNNIRDNDVRTMSWTRATTTLYANLKTYTNRDVNGNIPTAYLWDGTVKEMQGVAVKVLDVHAEPIAADYSLMKIDMTYKPVAIFDKMYKCQNTVGGGAVSFAAGNAIFGSHSVSYGKSTYGGAGVIISPLIVKVPDASYSVQAYDGAFNPLVTGSVAWAFNSSTGEYSITASSVPNASTATTILTFKNGWVTSKCLVTGLLDGSYFQLI